MFGCLGTEEQCNLLLRKKRNFGTKRYQKREQGKKGREKGPILLLVGLLKSMFGKVALSYKFPIQELNMSQIIITIIILPRICFCIMEVVPLHSYCK